MKKRIKPWAWALLVAAAVLALFTVPGLFSDDYEREISAFVTSNRDELETLALGCLNGDTEIKEYKGVEVEGAYSGRTGRIVQFYYSGRGLVPSTTYYGFYYSEDNVPAAFQNVDYALIPSSADEWTWSDGTDNGGRTKRIAERWFYYEAWF